MSKKLAFFKFQFFLNERTKSIQKMYFLQKNIYGAHLRPTVDLLYISISFFCVFKLGVILSRDQKIFFFVCVTLESITAFEKLSKPYNFSHDIESIRSNLVQTKDIFQGDQVSTSRIFKFIERKNKNAAFYFLLGNKIVSFQMEATCITNEWF